MHEPPFSGFAILEWSKFLMSETYYDTLPPYFGREYLQL